MFAWRTFYKMQEVLRGRLEQQLQADSGLSNADHTVLVALSEATGGQLRTFELGRRLGWEKRRLHHQLSRMCRHGLVQRRSGHGRPIHAAITAAGRTALEAAVPRHTQRVRRLILDQLTRSRSTSLPTLPARSWTVSTLILGVGADNRTSGSSRARVSSATRTAACLT